MSRPRVLIVGAGLGGCVLAHALSDTHEVVVFEREEGVAAAPSVLDVGRPALTDPHHGTGLGGSTRLWHHGLIEIDEAVFEAHWPYPKSTLDPWYRQAFRLLAGVELEAMRQATEALRRRHEDLGVSVPRHAGLYYPTWPMNLWKGLGLEGRVQVVRGEVVGVDCSAGAEGSAPGSSEAGRPAKGLRATGVRLRTPQGVVSVPGDVVVLAAGGLGTPLLLQALASQWDWDLPALRQAGCHYEDHPMGFVGEAELSAPLYRLWNVRAARGHLRLPIVLQRDGLHLSFQLRPAVRTAGSSRRERVDTALNQLRHRWWSPAAWLGVLRHRDDLLDILSFQFNLHLPTPHVTLLMVAQMPALPHRAVWTERPGVVCRDWRLPAEHIRRLERGLDDLLTLLKPVIRSARLFQGWPDQLRSAAHHSGTARLSRSAGEGVCNADAQVHGLPHLHVCDGSLIPASGIANTGLTIAALALRLAAHLQSGPHGAASSAVEGP